MMRCNTDNDDGLGYVAVLQCYPQGVRSQCYGALMGFYLIFFFMFQDGNGKIDYDEFVSMMHQH